MNNKSTDKTSMMVSASTDEEEENESKSTDTAGDKTRKTVFRKKFKWTERIR